MSSPLPHSNHDLSHLTGLRGLAAALILVTHVLNEAYGHLVVLNMTLAFFAMSLFFVLSGFVVCLNYAPHFSQKGWRKSARYFFVSRFARLCPLYFAALLMMGMLAPAAWKEANQLAYLTLTQSWFAEKQQYFGITWSVSTELVFYILFAFIIPLVNKIWGWPR